GHLQTNACGSATSQLLNLDPLQGGKSPTADRTVGHQRWLRCRSLRNVGINTRSQTVSELPVPPNARRSCQSRSWLIRCERRSRLAVRCGRHEVSFQVVACLPVTFQLGVEGVFS